MTTTGRTVEEAKDAALDTLGVDESDAEFEVLEEPRQGLFGRQRGEARVRARVRPTAPRPKVERRGRQKRGRDRGSAEANTSSVEGSNGGVAADVSAGPPPAGGGDGRKRRRRGGSGGQRNGDDAGDRQPRSAGRERSGRPAAEAVEQRATSEEMSTSGGDTVQEAELTLAAQGQIADEFIKGLLERFGASATTTVVERDEDTVEVQVTGPELGLLIGPKGQTLQAMQELARTVVQRRSVARTGRILVDIAGYRVKRREALERFTTQVANDVISSGVQRALEPMSAPDRKIVHDTATGIPGVKTISEGEDPRRRVVIMPAPAGDD